MNLHSFKKRVTFLVWGGTLKCTLFVFILLPRQVCTECGYSFTSNCNYSNEP